MRGIHRWHVTAIKQKCRLTWDNSLVSLFLAGLLSNSDQALCQFGPLFKPPMLQTMACRLFSTKPLSEPMLSSLRSCEQIIVKMEIQCSTFIQQNEFQRAVCKMTAISFLCIIPLRSAPPGKRYYVGCIFPGAKYTLDHQQPQCHI